MCTAAAALPRAPAGMPTDASFPPHPQKTYELVPPHNHNEDAYASQLNSCTNLRALLVLHDRGMLAFWPTQQATLGIIPSIEVPPLSTHGHIERNTVV
jgi:hypothetical protein